jgi:acetyl-CoA carboxylase biotin carboxyl carrier protein
MAEEVRAPLAGVISAVLVEVGAKVAEDDELVVIEALKMENLMYSPVAGTVKEVKVKKGDKVEEDAILIVIE